LVIFPAVKPGPSSQQACTETGRLLLLQGGTSAAFDTQKRGFNQYCEQNSVYCLLLVILVSRADFAQASLRAVVDKSQPGNQRSAVPVRAWRESVRLPAVSWIDSWIDSL
jgi:hypothetical protein